MLFLCVKDVSAGVLMARDVGGQHEKLNSCTTVVVFILMMKHPLYSFFHSVGLYRRILELFVLHGVWKWHPLQDLGRSSPYRNKV